MTDGSGVRRVVVVGAGPAGLAAAIEAARRGRRVVLVDERDGGGGQIWRDAARRGPGRAVKWLQRLGSAGVECRWQTAVVSADAGAKTLFVNGPQGASTVSFDRLVLATGARELFLPFPGWTLPGVVGVGGLQAMIKSGANFRGKEILLTGSGPLLLPVAALASRAGAKLVAVAEQTPAAELAWFTQRLWQYPGKVVAAASYRLRFLKTRYRSGQWLEAVTDAGDGRLQAVLTDGATGKRVDCDLVTAGYGLVPASELGLLLGCEARPNGALVVDADQHTSESGVFAAGEICGVGGADLGLAEGRIAGAAASGGKARSIWRRRRTHLRAFAAAMEEAFRPRDELAARPTADTIICRCEDVAWAAIDPDAGPRHNKLQSRCGMGLCQGRVCMPALKTLCGWDELSVVRPPIQPAPVSAFLAAGGADAGHEAEEGG